MMKSVILSLILVQAVFAQISPREYVELVRIADSLYQTGLPLKDPDMVDARRQQAGLPPLAEYVKQWGINWDPEEYKNTPRKNR
jgi:hypothetical protein